jgi:hypothetical protein
LQLAGKADSARSYLLQKRAKLPVLSLFFWCSIQRPRLEAAWQHMEEEAGEVISVFIENYIRPAIQGIEEVEIYFPKSINLSWSENEIKVSDNSASYVVQRV